jgi:hypothetical protein
MDCEILSPPAHLDGIFHRQRGIEKPLKTTDTRPEKDYGKGR